MRRQARDLQDEFGRRWKVSVDFGFFRCDPKIPAGVTTPHVEAAAQDEARTKMQACETGWELAAQDEARRQAATREAARP
jgi:hypothetical protein